MRALRLTLSFILALLFLVPISWMLIVSIKDEGMKITGVLDWYKPPYTFETYAYIFQETSLMRWMFNSLVVASIVTLMTLLFCSMSAFALSKIKFRYRKFIFVFILAGLLIPGEATLIPLYQVVKDLGMLDSYQGLILPAVASPFAVIVLASFFAAVPNELLESAEMDGGSKLRIYSSIVLPLAKPALASIVILTFIGQWNNFLWPFIAITSEELFTLPMGIPTLMSQYSEDYVRPMAINSVSSIPVMLAFLFFERQIVKGLSFSGIKG
ncbi:carbohydrate ABC transporter permease [Paenibacillus sedimenti]|uniref:Carbohydrate ABC transporter permease n=1 Tax=Paenibacillus sedimenti TaxID=2770274 RepID=A0A926KK61_9BACL|nr:carbohydrate ABC transporter permease [Paenibacillus sedimenti]MBD0378772.1 carbohydrate ABC transporter permease [Paenibacillus sedimenti]